MKPKTVGRVTVGQTIPPRAQNLCHGFPVGCPILTADGVLPVEYLSAGDRIVTRNGGMTQLTAITASTHTTRAVKITENAFAPQGPEQDVLLPADQPILVRDWRAQKMFGQDQAMTTAAQLVDGDLITDIGPRRLVLFKLEFDRPRVVYASGIELGTAPVINTPLRAVA